MKTHQRPKHWLHCFPRCVNGKVCLPSVRTARLAAKEMETKGITLYHYRCHLCGALHLTKMAQHYLRRKA